VDIWLKEGVLNGSMQVETHGARHLMNSHMHELKQSLEQQGIQVGNFNITLSQREQQGREMPFRSHFSDGSGLRQSSTEAIDASRTDLNAERARLLRGRHRLDLVA
jgi:flagellar hook-length control protein FliK